MRGVWGHPSVWDGFSSAATLCGVGLKSRHAWIASLKLRTDLGEQVNHSSYLVQQDESIRSG